MPNDVLGLTAKIVSAHVGNNSVAADALPDLINTVYRSLSSAGTVEEPVPAQQPAVPIRKSVFRDYIICLEDGKKLKTLKRHLKTSYNMSPNDYRAKWGLPHDYPMVAPAYAAHRSTLAKQIGLGRKRGEKTGTVPTEEPSAEPKVTIGKARKARGSKG